MGWCSATIIFDRMAEFVLSTDKPDVEKIDVLRALADVLEDNDWDCQGDSDYYEHPLVRQIFKELHPSWFDVGDEPERPAKRTFGSAPGVWMADDFDAPDFDDIGYEESEDT